MNPVTKELWTPEELARRGVRGIDAFTAEELAELRQKVEGWIGQRGANPRSKQRPLAFVMKPRPSGPA
jgi:hypothetical protein